MRIRLLHPLDRRPNDETNPSMNEVVAAVRWKLSLKVSDPLRANRQWHDLLARKGRNRAMGQIAAAIAKCAEAFLFGDQADGQSPKRDEEVNVLKLALLKSVDYTSQDHDQLEHAQGPTYGKAVADAIRHVCFSYLNEDNISTDRNRNALESWKLFVKVIERNPLSRNTDRFGLNDDINNAIRKVVESLFPSVPGNGTTSQSPKIVNGGSALIPGQMGKRLAPPPKTSNIRPIVGEGPQSVETTINSNDASLKEPPAPPAKLVPAATWKHLPVTSHEPDRHDESASKLITNGGYQVSVARTRGKSHKHAGTNCDDWFEVETTGPWTLIAVSDGAGSERMSRIGARAACQAALRCALKSFSQLDFQKSESENLYRSAIAEGVMGAVKELDHLGEGDSSDPIWESVLGGRKPKLSDYSATLLIAAHRRGKAVSENDYVVSAQIGDGSVAVISDELSVNVLGIPDSGSHAGQTEFLTSAKVNTPEAIRARVTSWSGKLEALLVMTDGVADDYFPSDPKCLCLWLDLILNRIVPPGSTISSQLLSDPVMISDDTLQSICADATRSVGPDSEQKLQLKSAKALELATKLPPRDLLRNRSLLARPSTRNLA